MYSFAIVGCGAIAPIHADQIRDQAKLVAVCDILPEKANQLAKQYGAKAVYDFDDLLLEPGIDVFCICTPNGYHAEHCIRALQAGKHVLSESPLCLTSAAAWQMVETEKYCRRKLFVAQPWNYGSNLKNARKILDAKTNGHPYHFQLTGTRSGIPGEADWRSKRFPGGGALYTHFAGAISMMVQLFGEITAVNGNVSGSGKGTPLETEENGEAELELRSGLKGMLSWQLGGDTEKTSLKLSHLTEAIDLGQALLTDQGLYRELYQNFLSGLDNDNSSSNLYEALKTVEAIEKIYKAILPNLSKAN